MYQRGLLFLWNQMSACCGCACNHLAEDSPFVQMDKKFRVTTFFVFLLGILLMDFLVVLFSVFASLHRSKFSEHQLSPCGPIMQPAGWPSYNPWTCLITFFLPTKSFQPKAFPPRTILVQTWWFGKENCNFILWHLPFLLWNLIRHGEWGIWGLTRKAFGELSAIYYIIALFPPTTNCESI